MTENYLHDGLDIIAQLDTGGNHTARYLRSLGIDEPWQRTEISAFTTVTNGILGWWKMNEGSGGPQDSGPSGYDGNLDGNAAWVPGQLGWAVAFDGNNDRIQSIGDHPEMESLNAFTFMAWINVNVFTNNDAQIFGKQNVYFYGLSGGTSNRVSLNVGNGSSYQGIVTNTTVLSTGVWYHVAATYTNSTVKFYVNGTLTNTITKTYTMGNNGQNFFISDNSREFNGRIDDVRIYNRALSDGEVASLAQTVGKPVYVADALGSIVGLMNATKSVATSYGYEPFGATTSSGGASGNSYKFTGREDDGTGLYYYRARYQNPSLGRFISEDPIGLAGGLNLYAHVANNPFNMIDPLGLQPADAYRAMEFVRRFPESLSDIARNAYQEFSSWQAREDLKREARIAAYKTDHPFLGTLAEGVYRGSQLPGPGNLGMVKCSSGSFRGFRGSKGSNPFHALDRAIERGVAPKDILNTLQNPTVKLHQGGGRTLYLTKDAAVVLDSSGQAVTIWGGANHDAKTLLLLKQAGGGS